MSNYKYTWKNDISLVSKRALDFPQPLTSGMIFVDLLNGKAYRVHSIHKAKEHDKFVPIMPDDVVQTFSARTLSDEELTTLRIKNKYEVQDDSKSNEVFALLD